MKMIGRLYINALHIAIYIVSDFRVFLPEIQVTKKSYMLSYHVKNIGR